MSPTVRRSSLLLFISIALIAVSILKGYGQSRTRIPNSIAGTGDAARFAKAVERDVSELQDEITVSQWKANHPGQEKEISPAPGAPECVGLKSTERLSGGGQIDRLVSFYPPEAPTPAILPNWRGKKLIDETCLLGEIRIEMSTASPEAARASSEAIMQELVRVYGPIEYKKMRWVLNAQWRLGNVDVISDYNIDGPYVYMDAGLRISNPSVRFDPKRGPDRAGELAEFRRAVASANIDPSISNRMEELYELDIRVSDDLIGQFEKMCEVKCPEVSPKTAGNEWREPLVPVLRDWLEALRPLAPDRRAAGLFAADCLLRAFEGVPQQGGAFGMAEARTSPATELRSKLESLGAEFTAEGDPVYSYASNWLEDASHLAPESDWGRTAAIAWMSKEGCQPPKEIISMAEKILATNPNGHAAAQAHFLIGDAYSDIVASAGWSQGSNGGDPAARYEGKAGMARSKALEHYTSGLASDSVSVEARGAWLQAWHLFAGLQPATRSCDEGD
jgi:hypothetical protein